MKTMTGEERKNKLKDDIKVFVAKLAFLREKRVR